MTTEIDCDSSYINEKMCNPNPSVDIPIEEIIPHENFNPHDQNLHNDIALLRLAQHAPYSSYIRPICLPVSETLQNYDLVSKTLTIAGWGATEHGSSSSIKLKANVDGISNADCQKVNNMGNRDIIEDQLCAGGEKGVDSW